VSNMKGVGKKNTLVHHKHVAGRPHYLIKTPTEYFFFASVEIFLMHLMLI